MHTLLEDCRHVDVDAREGTRAQEVARRLFDDTGGSLLGRLGVASGLGFHVLQWV
jgi:hypothetical protein